MLFIGPWESLFFSKPLFPLSYTQGANHSFYIIRLCQVKKKTDLDKEKLYSKDYCNMRISNLRNLQTSQKQTEKAFLFQAGVSRAWQRWEVGQAHGILAGV